MFVIIIFIIINIIVVIINISYFFFVLCVQPRVRCALGQRMSQTVRLTTG